MIRRRLYNPAQLTPDELKASFVARKDTLAEMIRLIREQPHGRPCQHMLLIGPRGMGKTTLGLRFLHAVAESPDLAAHWQPVPFYEESYDIGDLADFWLAALRHLTRATENPQWEDKAKALAQDERDPERLAAYALAALMDFCRASDKRLILFVENLDDIFGQLRDEREVHALRASLIECPDILLLGSANAVFNAIRSHGEPFYEFFRLFMLEGLGQEETLQILEALAGGEDKPEMAETLHRERGRLETLRRLTGGNPRLLVLACRLLIESPLGSAFEDLERLIDEQTPYFKARIEELPVQARKLFHCLAEGWKPMLAREVADAAKLTSSHTSAQLKQLVEKGYTREIRLPGTKRTCYEVSDRFYNIYYLLRFSRAGRDRLERLVAFLHDLFGPSGMRTMYPAVLTALRADGVRTGEASDLLTILAGYVAGDMDFKGREDWQREALDLAKNLIGPNAPVVGKIQEVFADQDRALLNRFDENISSLTKAGWITDLEMVLRKTTEVFPDNLFVWLLIGVALVEDKRFEDAILVFDYVLEHVSQDDPPYGRAMAGGALAGKGNAFLQLKRYEDALLAFDRILEHASQDDPPYGRAMAGGALACKGDAFFQLKRYEEAISSLSQVSEYIRPDDPVVSRKAAALAYELNGRALTELDRHEEALAAWQRVTEYVRQDDPVEPRQWAAKALNAQGDILAKLERNEEAAAAWERATEYVRAEDPKELRYLAFGALHRKSTLLSELKRYEEEGTIWRRSSEYIRPDDPIEPRRAVAMGLAASGGLSNLLGRHEGAEADCRRAIDIEPTYDEAWCVLATAILDQGDDARLPEAEECARHAIELAPKNPSAFHTLSDVLACRGQWTEALDQIEYALRIGGSNFQEKAWPGLTESLIWAVATGHGPRVKRIMEEAELAEPMEPLWHAVREELGEELEPLPAEIRDTVTEIRQEFTEKRR